MVDISFIGDISLNDDYVRLASEGKDPFAEASQVLKKSDLVVGNLECLTAGNEGENLLKKPRLKTSLKALGYLQNIKLGLATLAHNHVYDNLYDGFVKTLNFLDEEQIAHIGAGENQENAKKKYTPTIHGISFCFLNYVTDDTNPSLPENAKISLNNFELDDCLKELETLRNYNFRIVLMHWGGNFENGLYPDFNQPEIARKMIDAGADLIIGHHSHTFQPYEKYKNKYIFYSLGNFCFSDIHFEGKIRPMSSKRNRESALVSASFTESNYTIKIQPVRNEKLRIVFKKHLRLKFTCRNMLFFFLRKSKFLWNFYSLHFRILRPIIVQLRRKDNKRNFMQRIRELNANKIRKLIQK